MHVANQESLLSAIQELSKSDKRGENGILLLCFFGLLLLSLSIHRIRYRESKEAAMRSSRISIARASFAGLEQSSISAFIITVLFSLSVVILFLLTPFSCILSYMGKPGVLVRRILSTKMRYIFYVLAIAILAILPVGGWMLGLTSLSPEGLAQYEADILGVVIACASFWATKRLLDHRALDQRQISIRKVININNATQEELESIDGVGPILAQRIIEHRERGVRFDTIRDLRKVTGVGRKLLRQIQNQITV